eukprot:1670104-Rhodomonas_salina.1
MAPIRGKGWDLLVSRSAQCAAIIPRTIVMLLQGRGLTQLDVIVVVACPADRARPHARLPAQHQRNADEACDSLPGVQRLARETTSGTRGMLARGARSGC